MQSGFDRRRFLGAAAGLVAAGATPHGSATAQALSQQTESKNDRLQIGVIGAGGRGSYIACEAARLGDVVAVCDVDLQRAEKLREQLGAKAAVYQDYRKLLDRKDIDAITNGTPDHWHTPINVDACRAGKDVYTEKPLTLTIDEGKLLRNVVERTGRVVQVGTQLRCVPHIQLAIELIRNGRLGKLQEVNVSLLYKSTEGGPFAVKPAPAYLDWDLYQGQAPARDYCPERTHYSFRWWSEYAGGIVTDWGAHDIDIAHWGMDLERSGPLTVEAAGTFPNEGRPDCFNNADEFKATLAYPGGLTLTFASHKDVRAGVMFIGDRGRLLVNRGGVFGKPFEQLKDDPLPEHRWKVAAAANHMANFFDCVKSRQTPIAPVEVAHRTATVCHLTNIAMRLKQKLTWDAKLEQVVGDDEANAWQKRQQRESYRVLLP